MPKTILHRSIRIVVLDHGESIAQHCQPDDIAIVKDESGWWTCFVGEDGAVDRYDIAFDSLDKAVHTAKAAAEFATE